MSSIQVACQTYTWEMLGEAWQGKTAQILDWVADAGYAGIEITNQMIGEFRDGPQAFAQALHQRGLRLAAYAYSSPSGFTDPDAWQSDLAGADQLIKFLGHFPGATLQLGGASHPSRDHAQCKLDQAIRFYHEVGRRAAAEGVGVGVHPHSHHGSLIESAAEYAYLLAHLAADVVSFGPDTGHIVRGGQDLLTCLRAYMPRITHLHLKDANAQHEWTPLGEGMCDYPGVMALLEAANYQGWIVAEEESEAARHDGVAAIIKNRNYLRTLGY